jgi:diguanylate cyclase (GGDEF)-like protein/PAS domain S-box-containing protein
MKYLSPAVKVSVALVLLTMTILVLGDLIGVIPDERKGLIDGRKKFCESLAVQISMAVTRNELELTRATLKAIVERNPDVLSVALRTTDNELLAEAGDHAKQWVDVPLDKSTATHVQVPIFSAAERWGTIEVAFTSLSQKPIAGTVSRSFVGLLLFVALCGFVFYLVFIKRVLRELDPGAVIPERVKSAFNTLGEGLLIMDEKEQIVLANDTFALKVGTDPEKLIGKRASELAWNTGDRHNKVDFPWQLSLRKQERQIGLPLDFQYDKKTKRTFMVNATPISDTKGVMRGVLATFNDMTELEKQHKQQRRTLVDLRKSKQELQDKTAELEILASHDPLTGCLNRRAFMKKLDVEFSNADENRKSLTCVMIDIDHFKPVNDRFGHTSGDQVLQFVAKLLRSNSRPEDLVARYGGEEFCWVLPGVNLEEGFAIAERTRRKIYTHPPMPFAPGLRVTVSLGVAELATYLTESSELIDLADKALYLAKESGRNRTMRWQGESVTDYTDNEDLEISVQPANELVTDDSGPMQSTLSPDDAGELKRLRQSVKEMEAELDYKKVEEQLLAHDELTGLPSRALFTDRIQHALAYGHRHNRSTAVVSLEIDSFDRVNDAHGRVVGDRLLQRVAARLVGILRDVDTVAAVDNPGEDSAVSLLNSDEFGIVLTDLPNAEPVAWIVKRIFDKMSERVEIDGHEILVRFNAGVSLSPHDSSDPEALIENATTARHAITRRLGHNQMRFFSPDINESSRKSLWFESQLHRALEDNQFSLHYQPKIDVMSWRIIGMEALIRWQHPTMGMISPGQFIPIAERTGFIHPISEWVMKTACQQAHEWIDKGFSKTRVAVNLSSVQFRRGGLAQEIASILNKTGLPPDHLELEITETTLMENVGVAVKTITELHDFGVHFSIDDFGTGYSSLGSLKNLPVDSVKIDRSFLGDTHLSEQDQLIVTAIVSMSHSMRLRVVAEGVETDSQLTVLRNLKCDELQGNLYSKPVPAYEATRLLERDIAGSASTAA